MVDKKEWDEIEKWNTQRVIGEKEKTKFYYEKFEKNKNIDKVTKSLKITGIILRIIAHIVLLIAIIIGIQILATKISSKV